MWTENIGKTKATYHGKKLMFHVEYSEKNSYAVSVQQGITDKILTFVNAENLIDAKIASIEVMINYVEDLQSDIKNALGFCKQEITNFTTNTDKN